MSDTQCWFHAVEGCPMCGSKNVVYTVKICVNGMSQARAKCLDCGHTGAITQIQNETTGRSTTRQGAWARQVKERDGFQCRICGSKNEVHAHHIIPRAHDPEERFLWSIDNGITVCRFCHRMIHGWDL